MNVHPYDLTQQILRNSIRYRYLDVVQIQAMLDGVLGPRAVEARCSRRVKLGLLIRLAGGVRPCWTATSEGIYLVGEMNRTVTAVSAYFGRHTTAVADLGIDLERRGVSIRTERELYGAQVEHRQTHGVRTQLLDGWPRDTLIFPDGEDVDFYAYDNPLAAWKSAWDDPHMPDLEATIDGIRTAVEVELTQKTNARVEDIFRFYASPKSQYQAVHYYCATATIHHQILRISRQIAPAIPVTTYLPATPLHDPKSLTSWSLAS